MESVPKRQSSTRALNRYQQGVSYESLARRYLERAGLTFIAANVRYRGGELDLIMRDQQCWVFVEVRYRKSARFGSATESITARKRHTLLRAASLWLASKGSSFENADCRFDVVAITGQQLTWLANAFNTEC